HPDGLTMCCWREEWHRWDASAYRILPDKELRAELAASAQAEMDRVKVAAQKVAAPHGQNPPTPRKGTRQLTGKLAHALASLTLLPGHIEAPAWLDGDGPFPAAEILACRNALVHLPSLVAGNNYFTPPTPRFFSPTCLDLDFTLQAPEPSAWLGFLA